MELTGLTIALIGLAFITGAALGWLLKRPSSVIVESPDRQREKVLFEAQHKIVLGDIQSHLDKTSAALQKIAEQQEDFAISLKNEQQAVRSSGSENLESPAMPPRDYSDTRGQLDS